VATVIGTVAGIVSGYLRGLADTAVRGVTDVMLGIPPLAMMIVIGALIGSLSLRWLAFAIGLLTWPLTARAIRSQVLALREQPFVLMSRLSNRSAPAIMFLELLPNVLALVIASLIGVVSGGLAVAVGLQLLGIGPTDVTSLGLTLQEAITRGSVSQGLWWWWAPPAAILVTFFVGLFLTSLAVDEIANPRLKGARPRG
jgi:peptide/nickel transport system permease protein